MFPYVEQQRFFLVLPGLGKELMNTCNTAGIGDGGMLTAAKNECGMRAVSAVANLCAAFSVGSLLRLLEVFVIYMPCMKLSTVIIISIYRAGSLAQIQRT